MRFTMRFAYRYTKWGLTIIGLLWAVPVPAATLWVTAFGAQCDNLADDTAEIQAAFNSAGSGDTVRFPSGTCRYSENLVLKNKSDVRLVGSGMNASRLRAVDPEKSAVRILNSVDVTVERLQVTSPSSTERSAQGDATGFHVKNGSNVEFRRVKVQKTASAGIFFEHHTDGGVFDSKIIRTRADGIHITGGSQGVELNHNYAFKTGDDSFSCVGYTNDPRGANRFIGFYRNRSVRGATSGITVEGCEFVEVHDNVVRKSGLAGIRVASSDFWKSGRVNEVDVWSNVLSDVRQDSSVGHPAILVYTDYRGVKNVHIRNNRIVNPRTWAAFQLYGVGTGKVRKPDLTNNDVSDGFGNVTDCLAAGSGVIGAVYSGNLLNGGACEPEDQ